MRSPDKKVAVETPHRIPRFRSPLGTSGGVGAETWAGLVASVFPEFIARDGQERADGGRQGDKRRGGAARSRLRRGPGPARLDGTRPWATVADKVMKSGKTDRQATAARAPTPRKRSV